MNLFESHRQQITAAEAPLADRLRPRTLEEFIGQEHIRQMLQCAIQLDYKSLSKN